MSYTRITKWLVNQRNLAGLSQSQLSEKLSKTQSFVSKYENGGKNLTLEEFLQICRILNCNPCDVIKGEMEK